MRVNTFKDANRHSSRFYVVPLSNNFSNVINYAYGFDGDEAEAALFADYVDGRIVDEDWIKDKRERMHLAEGCSHSRDYEHDYEIESADEWVDHVDVDFEEDEDDQ